MGAMRRGVFGSLRRKIMMFLILFALVGSALAASYTYELLAFPANGFLAQCISTALTDTPEPYELILIGAGLIALFGIAEIGYKIDSWLQMSRAK